MSKTSTPMASGDLGPGARPRKVRVVCIGELLWDIFPDRRCLGGASANVAYHAARLGADSHLISRVGADALGRDARKLLTLAGLNLEQVANDATHPTGTVRVHFDSRVNSKNGDGRENDNRGENDNIRESDNSGEPVFSIASDAAWDHVELGQAELSLAKSADVLCYGTLFLRTRAALTRMRQLLTAVKKSRRAVGSGPLFAGRPLCLLDLNLRPPFALEESIFEAISFADVIKLNEEECAWIARVKKTDDPVGYLLKHSPARLVALTRGPRGARLCGHVVSVDVPGIPVSGGDPVGAGDAFVAGLALGLSQGKSVARVLEESNRYAAWVASQSGAMPGLG